MVAALSSYVGSVCSIHRCFLYRKRWRMSLVLTGGVNSHHLMIDRLLQLLLGRWVVCHIDGLKSHCKVISYINTSKVPLLTFLACCNFCNVWIITDSHHLILIRLWLQCNDPPGYKCYYNKHLLLTLSTSSCCQPPFPTAAAAVSWLK